MEGVLTEVRDGIESLGRAWRLQNDRFCDPWERSEIRALGGLTIGILN